MACLRFPLLYKIRWLDKVVNESRSPCLACYLIFKWYWPCKMPEVLTQYFSWKELIWVIMRICIDILKQLGICDQKKKKHTVEWTVWPSQITYFNVMVCWWYGMQLNHYSLMLYILVDLYLVLGLKRTSTELHVSVNWFMLVFWAQKFFVFNF